MADFNHSVFPGASGVDAGDDTLTGVLRRALAEAATGDWQQASDGFWVSLSRPAGPRRAQGWKLHVSATPAAAAEVLSRVLPVLLAAESPFKFASTIAHVGQLNARHTPRGHSGKFLTVYPSSDAEAVRIAAELHAATAGLPGPRILSDRPYAPGSLVHYRYGAFVEDRRLGNDGLYAWVILDPDGNPVEDRRIGQYLPPSWAPSPFPEPAPPAAGSGSGNGGPQRDGAVLVGDRFLVREAIRHVNKGGVYRATDTRTGTPAILKEARPHVAADMAGRDVRDLLRAEARALERIGPLGAAPPLLALFEQSGHLFLAEELVPGVALREWVLDRIRGGGWRRRIPDALAMAERLVELMALAHRAGLILRDFTPNNVMVRPDGQLRLIDLELAVLHGQQEEELTGAGTPGYAAPEQMAGAPAAVAADHYSLGATLCFALTGSTPELLPDVPTSRSLRDRVAEWLAVRGIGELPPPVGEAILGLMDAEPERRWTTAAAGTALAAARAAHRGTSQTSQTSPASRVDTDGELLHERYDQVIDGAVSYLLDTMRPADPERLWPVSCAQGSPDPCIVQLGAAGVLGVLTRCVELTGDDRLPAAIGTAGRWITERARADGERPPGLYFGAAGVAWALYDAGRALGDGELAGAGLALAAQLPVSAPNPDVTHGTAGIGLTLLHLGLRAGDEALVARAVESADVLVGSADDGPDGLIWGTPAAFDSRLAGGRFYGFAHGTAGVGHFLLATALATDRSDLLDLAHRCGETLLDTATVSDGVALWGPGPGDDTTAPYWCHGSAGIGAFLTRLHRATGDDRFDKVARMSTTAVMENSWRGVLGQCHGLAGNGEFLLDMADMADMVDAGDSAAGLPFVADAARLARVLLAGGALQGDRMIFPNEEGQVSAMWADGMSGILSFLLRLRHRSPRLWMVDAELPWSARL